MTREFAQSIRLIAKSKREDTRNVARSYLVQVFILAGIISVFVWAMQLPGVQRVNGLGLSGGFDYVGLVRCPYHIYYFSKVFQITHCSQSIFPNKCKPQQDWKSGTEIGACTADLNYNAESPNFTGCSDSFGLKVKNFVEMANSISSYELLQDDSGYRCIDLEMLIKNNSLSAILSSKLVCTYNMELVRNTLLQTRTFFVRLFKCPSGSSSIPNPYAGCFPVKRSVSQMMTNRS